MSDNQVIFSMVRVGKIVQPNNRQILRDISLGFYYGAKIGVLGLNGAGKSTLLRIIAGKDDQYVGDVVFSPGYSVGMLEQEPQLDPNKTVQQIVEEAVQPLVDMLKKFDEVSEKFGEPDADFDALIAEQGKLQEELDKHDAWNLQNRPRSRYGRPALPAGRLPHQEPLRRRAPPRGPSPACCSPSRTFCCWTSPPTIWIQNLSPGWSVTCNSTRGR